jgi:hypothetical protein
MVREGGRQLVIERGGTPEADEVDPPDELPEAEEASSSSTATRGKITEFSEDARRRLRRLVHSIERDEDALFLTLTWHENLPTPDEAKAALDRFGKRMRRAFPGASFVWKMEPQRRGFPHFHVLAYGVNWIDPQAISRLWHEVTQEVSEQHRKSGVDVEWVRSDGKLQAYLSKYFSKAGEGWPEEAGEDWKTPGRFWGVIARKNLPVAAWSDWRKYIHPNDAARLIGELLDEWGVDLDGVIPPSLTVNTRGDPTERLDALLDRL